MHWKVLCFCRSHGSLICCVLMYSIYSGLFSWANLAMCQTYICASTKQARIDGLFDLLERETSHHGALYHFFRMRFPSCTHHIICECGESLEWDMYFMETVSVLNFCSPLYINLKFSRKVLIFNFFFNDNISSSWSFLTF